MRVKAYLHSSKESMSDLGEEHGMSEDQINYFMYALSEVEFELEVNDAGEAEIIKVNGCKLEPKSEEQG